MKSKYFILIVLLQLMGVETFSQKMPFSVSGIIGVSPAKKGLEFGAGYGIKAGVHINKIYAGGALFMHAGDELSIRYGSVGGLGISGGRQKYKWNPKFIMADAGYEIKIPLMSGISSSLMPYFSMGLASITVKSSGVYGNPDNLHVNKFGIGGGFSYSVALTEKISAGLEYRFYPLGDVHFDFGNFSNGEIEHGFHTYAFYDALFAVVTYKL